MKAATNWWCRNGSIGFRWGEEGTSWNLEERRRRMAKRSGCA
jgi:nitrate reductase alpha subunit